MQQFYDEQIGNRLEKIEDEDEKRSGRRNGK